MPGTPRRIASASSAVSVVTAPCPWRTGPKPPEPALTITMFEPALRIWFWIDALAPVPIATITITAATPMIMPSAVSAVRIAFRRSALTATTNVIRNDMAAPLRDAAALDGAVVAHQSVAECNHARAVFGDVGLVRHEDDGDAREIGRAHV